MEFDNLYYERVATAVSVAIDAASTAPMSGTVHVKPSEVAAALAALMGRVLGLAEQNSGSQVSADMLDTLKGLIDSNLGMVRAAGDLAAALQAETDRAAASAATDTHQAA